MNDARIAREWAEKALDNDLLDEVPIEGYRAAARHILATTSPTMADIAWDDEVHVGLCALHADGDLVRMIGPDPAGGGIICHWAYYDVPVTGRLLAENLTPLPGTKIDLTPRRESEPEFLETEEDYRGAPNGTVVWGNGPSSNMGSALERYGNAWIEAGDDGTFTPRHMAAAGPHQVLRWGEAS